MSPAQAVSPARETRHSAEMVPDRYSVCVATTAEKIEALRPIWKNWADSLDADMDYFLHNLAHDSTVLRPYAITVYSDGIAQAMLVGQIKKRRASSIISFVNIPGPSARVLEIRKGGRMGLTSPAIDRLLVLEFLKLTRSGHVDSICFERLPLQSALFLQLQELSGLLVRERVPHVFRHSVLLFTAPERTSLGVFPGKMRREVRRKTRIVERAFPGQVRLKCFAQLGELDAALSDAMRVAAVTWQRHLAQGLMDNAETRATLCFFAKQGWLRIYLLYVKDAPCAFLVGQRYNNTFYCRYAGYDPNFAQFSVGSLLTARAFEHLAAAGVDRVDLGEGGQEHSRRLGCQMSEEGTVHVYSPTLHGICFNLFFGATRVVQKTGSRARSALKLRRLSITWRQYLLAKRRPRQNCTRPDVQASLRTERKHG